MKCANGVAENAMKNQYRCTVSLGSSFFVETSVILSSYLVYLASSVIVGNLPVLLYCSTDAREERQIYALDI